MITLKRLNVVREVATDEQADKLVAQGFSRAGGSAEGGAASAITEANFAKMSEAMFERLNESVKEAVAKAAVPDKSKAAKGGNKEGINDGAGSDPPDNSDGAK